MMIKQKIVLEVSMPDDKCRLKAKKVVASTEGLISMAIEVDKNQLVLVGLGMDAAILATLLRKKVGRATIVSVEEVKSEEKKKEEEAAKKKKEEEAKKKKEEEAKKKQEEEDAKNRNVTWRSNHYNHHYAPPIHGYDLVQYGAPRYPNSWFSW